MDSEKSEVKGDLKLEKLPIALCLGETTASSMWQRYSRSKVLQSGCTDEGWALRTSTGTGTQKQSEDTHETKI